MTDSGPMPADERVRRSVRRTIANIVVVTTSLAILGAWSWFGFYQLEPGQAAVILRFGKYSRTTDMPGLQWHLPPPLEAHEVLNVASIEREEFGIHGSKAGGEPDAEAIAEASMQTSDNNIVSLGFVVQYRVKDAFAARFRVEDPRATLRDAAQATMREVVGRYPIDGVLSEQRGMVATEAAEALQQALDGYQAGIAIVAVQLQEVQPPAAVRSAFDDVIAAQQDRSRSVNEAQGYANEVLPRARGTAAEVTEQARGYREAKIAEATGEASRFGSLVTEYRKAPELTRRRLYFEMMEVVLPRVQTLVVEPGTANVLPYLPFAPGGRGLPAPNPAPPGGATPAVSAPAGAAR
jgi:membrane protease subunit HflK